MCPSVEFVEQCLPVPYTTDMLYAAPAATTVQGLAGVGVVFLTAPEVPLQFPITL